MINKGFTWNPSNCEFECDKSCDVGEYLDHENCKCRNKLVDKLTEECAENIDEVRIDECNSVKNKCKHNSCTLYIVLFSIVFTINVGIATYFVYYKYRIIIKKMLLGMIMFIKQKIININGESQTNFYNGMINLKRFKINLLKIDKKYYKGINIY